MFPSQKYDHALYRWLVPDRFNGAGMFPSQKSLTGGFVYEPLSAASMGPGCFHPRNDKLAEAIAAGDELQWGRDVSIPEMAEAILVAMASQLLQWGRDVSIPEMARQHACIAVLARLQWGRDVSIPEIKSPEVENDPDV